MSETKETACEMENVRNFVEMAHQVGGHATTKTSACFAYLLCCILSLSLCTVGY